MKLVTVQSRFPTVPPTYCFLYLTLLGSPGARRDSPVGKLSALAPASLDLIKHVKGNK